MTRLAFVGLGAMGGRMARRLLDAGHNLVVYNRTAERTRPLVEVGATAATTPAEAAAGADVVVTMVADPSALRAVVEGPDGVAAGVGPSATVIDMSTVGPAEVARLRRALPAAVGLLDAPVLGSLGEAEAGTLRLFVGGPGALVDRQRPLLEVLGTPLHVGDLGSGATAKLVANSTLFGVLGALGEAVALGDGLGLPREATMAVLAATPLGEQAQRRAAVLEADAPTAPRFALSLARKDADLVAVAAAEHGVDLRLAVAAGHWLAEAEQAGHGAADYSWVLKTILGGRLGVPEGTPVAAASAPRDTWADGCDAWRLLRRPGLAVAEERMAPGTSETRHLHRRARQFFYVLAGEGSMTIGDRRVRIGTGEALEVPPAVPHRIENHGDGDLRFLVVSSPTTTGDRFEVPDGPPTAGTA